MPVRAKTFEGAVGEDILPGKDKLIFWTPEDDAIYLDEDITVELLGEKYVRSFNKSLMVLSSTLIP